MPNNVLNKNIAKGVKIPIAKGKSVFDNFVLIEAFPDAMV